MSKRPPDDEDPILRSILDQVQDAFSEGDAGPDDELQQSLLVGVRDTLRALLGGEAGEPSVTVVDGGRPDNAPPSKSGRPDLRVAGQEDAEEGSSVPPPEVKVRVLRPAERQRRPASVTRAAALQHGIVALDATGDSQWIYHGSSAARYRIYCTRGRMALPMGEGESLFIGPGQSMDIEASKIRVFSEDGGAEGRYLHLKT
jgi:hypothetical protein